MHSNHDTDLMSDWELSQLIDDEDQDQEEVQQEFTGVDVW